MKKSFSLIFIASLLLSACAGMETPIAVADPTVTPQNVTATSTPEPAVETATRLDVNEEALNGLEISVWLPWYGVEAGLFESFANQFNAENEWGIKVSTKNQVSFANLYETVTASLPTSERPTMVIALPEHAQWWNDNGVVADLTPYAQDPRYGMDATDIPIVFWNQDLAGDVRVGIPAQRTAQFLLRNETWAGELGFASVPGTSTEFRRQACGANASLRADNDPANDALGGWLVNTESMTAHAWMLSFGGGVLEEGNYRFLAPGNVETFKFLRELSENGCAWQSTSANPFSAFANRQALFITADVSDLPDVARAFAAANSTDNWSVLPFPSEDGGLIAVYGSSYVVLNASNEEELAAWLFIRWLLEEEQDARWVEVTHLFPLRSSTLSLLGDYERSRPQWRQAVDLIPQGEMQPQLGSWRTVKIMLGDGFAHMYRVNVASGQVAAILAQMESMARDLSE